jgi:putative transposase
MSLRTYQRWRKAPTATDQRHGPRTKPRNALTATQRKNLLRIMNSNKFRDLPPPQIVPLLADRGKYYASESTMYRVLREEHLLAHRGHAKPREPRPVPIHVATAPRQVISWDITYLRSAVRGEFYYLYMHVDLFSRKIVAWAVHEHEDDVLAAALVERCMNDEGITSPGVILHSDNGGPMRGSNMVAKLDALGIRQSLSRPRVSNDNPYSESLFRTLKYRPTFPSKPFASIEAARAWVAQFVHWYNTQHRHSAIEYVTPDERHAGKHIEVLSRREALYTEARRRHPERWSGPIRDWTPTNVVRLNRPRDLEHEKNRRHHTATT